jgi:hypothetical protein
MLNLNLAPGQTLCLPRTGARFTVTELSGDGTRAVVSGVRTGARLLVIADARGRLTGRRAVDNGKSGASLFDSLDPVGQRYRMVAWTT